MLRNSMYTPVNNNLMPSQEFDTSNCGNVVQCCALYNSASENLNVAKAMKKIGKDSVTGQPTIPYTLKMTADNGEQKDVKLEEPSWFHNENGQLHMTENFRQDMIGDQLWSTQRDRCCFNLTLCIPFMPCCLLYSQNVAIHNIEQFMRTTDYKQDTSEED